MPRKDRWEYHEVKCGKTDRLTPKEEEFRDENPRKHKVHHVGCDNPLHDVRNLGRAAKKIFK